MHSLRLRRGGRRIRPAPRSVRRLLAGVLAASPAEQECAAPARPWPQGPKVCDPGPQGPDRAHGCARMHGPRATDWRRPLLIGLGRPSNHRAVGRCGHRRQSASDDMSPTGPGIEGRVDRGPRLTHYSRETHNRHQPRLPARWSHRGCRWGGIGERPGDRPAPPRRGRFGRIRGPRRTAPRRGGPERGTTCPGRARGFQRCIEMTVGRRAQRRFSTLQG